MHNQAVSTKQRGFPWVESLGQKQDVSHKQYREKRGFQMHVCHEDVAEGAEHVHLHITTEMRRL